MKMDLGCPLRPERLAEDEFLARAQRGVGREDGAGGDRDLVPSPPRCAGRTRATLLGLLSFAVRKRRWRGPTTTIWNGKAQIREQGSSDGSPRPGTARRPPHTVPGCSSARSRRPLHDSVVPPIRVGVAVAPSASARAAPRAPPRGRSASSSPRRASMRASCASWRASCSAGSPPPVSSVLVMLVVVVAMLGAAVAVVRVLHVVTVLQALVPAVLPVHVVVLHVLPVLLLLPLGRRGTSSRLALSFVRSHPLHYETRGCNRLLPPHRALCPLR